MLLFIKKYFLAIKILKSERGGPIKFVGPGSRPPPSQNPVPYVNKCILN